MVLAVLIQLQPAHTAALVSSLYCYCWLQLSVEPASGCKGGVIGVWNRRDELSFLFRVDSLLGYCRLQEGYFGTGEYRTPGAMTDQWNRIPGEWVALPPPAPQ